MSLADIVRSVVAIADTVTKDLQPVVSHQAWISQDEYGSDTFATAVPRRAIVDRRNQQRFTSTGKLVMVLAKVTFLEPVPPNGASGRVEPIDPRDIITLDDGQTAPIVTDANFEDAGTKTPFYNDVTLGVILK